MIPPLATVYLPILAVQIAMFWPDYPRPSEFAGQIEQETCVSLTSKRCWSPRAELRTSRERGVGLGQITKTSRFDALAEMKQAHPTELSGWSWDNPYDASLQIAALVLKDRDSWLKLGFAADHHERAAMMFSAYNGGLGGVLNDRRLCASTKGCDPTRWYGHVEQTSLKARLSAKGYGQSFFCINRTYPHLIMFKRADKYRTALPGPAPDVVPPSPSRMGC